MLWFTVDCDLPDHPKMAALPNDAARYGWIVALARAKRQRQQGTFSSDVHFRTVVGKYGKYLPDYIKAKLLDKQPDGSLVVHDWDRHQWKVKKAGQRGDNEGTNEGQKEDPRAGARAVSVSVSKNGGEGVQGKRGLAEIDSLNYDPDDYKAELEAKTKRRLGIVQP